MRIAAGLITYEASLEMPEGKLEEVIQLDDRGVLREVRRISRGTVSPLRFPHAKISWGELWRAFHTRL